MSGVFDKILSLIGCFFSGPVSADSRGRPFKAVLRKMGCLACLVMFIFMLIGAIQWNNGSLWGPIFFWILASMAGLLSVTIASYPQEVDEPAPPEDTKL